MTLHEQKERLLEDIACFVRIPSRSCPGGGEEGALQAEIAMRMRRLGARVRAFEPDEVKGFYEHALCHGPERNYAGRPTVVGELGPPDAPALLLLAHSDTVGVNRPDAWTVDPFGAVQRDGMLCGLGCGDDKWGLATMLAILEWLQRSARVTPLRKRVIFASTIDEESGVGNGTLLLMLAGVRAHAALYLDGSNYDVCIGCNGGSNLYLRPQNCVDAGRRVRHTRELEKVAAEMSARRAALYDQPYFIENPVRNASVKFGVREEGGTFAFVLSFYNPLNENRQAFVSGLESAVALALGNDYSKYALSYREPWFEPALLPEATPLVRHLAAAVREVTNRPARITTISKQDSFLLTNHAGIPTVSFGVSQTTDPGGYHAPDEAISLDAAWNGFRATQCAVQNWLEDASP